MTEATGSGVGDKPWIKSWTAQAPDSNRVEIAVGSFLGGVRIANAEYETVYIHPDLIDWLIDTLVLAKEQVARPGIPDNPDEWVYAGTRKNPIKEQVGREYHDPR